MSGVGRRVQSFDRGNGFGRRESFSNFFGFNHLRRSCPGPGYGRGNASILQLTRVLPCLSASSCGELMSCVRAVRSHSWVAILRIQALPGSGGLK